MNFQDIVFVLVSISTLIILAAGERRLYLGFTVAILLLATGYRRVFLTQYIEIHSSELMLWLMAVLLLFDHKKQAKQVSNNFHLPRWMSLFIFFWPWVWVMSLSSDLPLDVAFNQFKPFLILPVVFWLTWKLLKEVNGFYIMAGNLFVTGSLIGGLGLFEYYEPGIAAIVPGFSALPFVTADYMGFTRAHFSFYGAPTATFMLVMTAPLGLALWQQAGSFYKKIMLFAGFTMQVLGIYIGGYRSMWLTLGIELIIFVMLYRGVFAGVFGLIPLVVIYQSLPSEALLRLSTLFLAVEGHAVDSSAIGRIDRIHIALSMLQKNPFGFGWGASGWTHNDPLQIAVNLGVIAALIFIVAYLLLVFRLGKKVLLLRSKRASTDFQITLALLLSLIGSGFVYVGQGITWQIFLVLPAWMIWALAEYWITEPPIVNLQESANAAQNIRTTPRFQQRRYSPRDPRIRPLD